MAITSKFLRDIEAEARPIIERQINDAKIIAGLRDVVSANGGDWGALKALIKARVEDDNDESGEGKRVRKIREKADCTVAYDDMLGSNMNENNFSAGQSYAEAKGVERPAFTVTPEAKQVMAAYKANEAKGVHTAHSPITDTQEQPETASQSDGDAFVAVKGSARFLTNAAGVEPSPSVSIPHSSADLLPGKADQTSEAVNPPAASLVTPDGTKLLDVNSGSDPLLLHPSLAAGQAGAVTSLENAPAPATITDDEVPAFLRKGVPVDVTSPEFILRLRPFCQNLDDCHGHGRECAKCKAARAA